MESEGSKPCLITLPPEIFTIIATFAGSDTYATLRLTCKHVRDLVHNQFGIAFFKERKHVMSRHSMHALVDITAHPLLGPFVKKITIGEPKDRKVSKRSHSEAARTRPEHFRQLLERIFLNIKQHSNAVIVGVDSGYPQALYGSRSHNALTHLLFDPVLDYAGLLEHMVGAAQQAQCQINGLCISLCGTYFHPLLGAELRWILRKFLSSRTQPRSLSLSYPASFKDSILVNPSLENKESLEFNHETGLLKFSNNSFERIRSLLDNQGYLRRGYSLNFFPYLDSTFDWLSTCGVSRLNLYKCAIDPSQDLNAFLSPALKSLVFDDVDVKTGAFERNFWGDYLERIANQTNVDHFKLAKPKYRVEPSFDGYLSLSSGSFKLVCMPFYTAGSGLRFSLKLLNESDEFVAQGVDTSAQIKKLAAYMAEKEAAKIRRIERDNCVMDTLMDDFEYDDDEPDLPPRQEHEAFDPGHGNDQNVIDGYDAEDHWYEYEYEDDDDDLESLSEFSVSPEIAQ